MEPLRLVWVASLCRSGCECGLAVWRTVAIGLAVSQCKRKPGNPAREVVGEGCRIAQRGEQAMEIDIMTGREGRCGGTCLQWDTDTSQETPILLMGRGERKHEDRVSGWVAFSVPSSLTRSFLQLPFIE